jgi:hypothetical protein
MLRSVLHRRGLSRRNPGHLVRCVREAVLFGARLVRSRAARPAAEARGIGSSSSRRSGSSSNSVDEDKDMDALGVGGGHSAVHAGSNAKEEDCDRKVAMWDFNTEFDFSVVLLVGYLSFIAVLNRRRQRRAGLHGSTNSSSSSRRRRSRASSSSRPGCGATLRALAAQLSGRARSLRSRLDDIEARTHTATTHSNTNSNSSAAANSTSTTANSAVLSPSSSCSDWAAEVVRRVSKEMFAKVPGW